MKQNDTEFKSLENLLGYTFRDKRKLIQALTHSSHKNEFIHGEEKGSALDRTDNERFEFFGDAILSFVISKRLFDLYPDKHEGDLSQFRSLLVSRKSLFTIAKKTKLHHFLRLGKSEKEIKLKDKAKMVADAFEAIIAGIYLDRGMRAAETFIENHFSPYLNISKLKRISANENYKSILQEYTQKDFHQLPKYETIQDALEFRATIFFQDKPIGQAHGKSKRDAEKLAAKAALQYYKKHIRPAIKNPPTPA